jgi:hypothetical protein
MSCLILAVLSRARAAAHAQFGSGIVYDPTQSAHAVQEIEQGEQQLQKWATELNNWQQHLLKEAQIFTTAEQTRTQIVTMYNLAYQMATMPQNLEARYKADWAQWQSLAAPPNTYGNTSPLVNALNFGGLPQAQQGYNSAYVQVQSYPSGNYSSLDSRTQATVANQYATSELAQTTTTNTLSTLGTIRTNESGVRIEAHQPRIGYLLDRSQPADPERPARQDQLRHAAPDPLAAGHQPASRGFDSAAAHRAEAADRRAEPRPQ